MNDVECPVCNYIHDAPVRYPDIVCNKCLRNFIITDINGNIIEFNNETDNGFGLIKKTFYNNDRCIYTTCKSKEDVICFINGTKCYAEEARFGGKVIIGHRV
tara:strand:+ start:334 stop:639 length:306 start_codon:yes stop_codon:yes gene_type:complete